MIKRFICLGAVAVLAIGCASNRQANDLDGGDQSGNLPAQTQSEPLAASNTVTTSPAVTTPGAAPKSVNSGQSYTVQKGDSLWKIANHHGVTVDALKKANNLTNDMLHPGQTLVIP